MAQDIPRLTRKDNSLEFFSGGLILILNAYVTEPGGKNGESINVDQYNSLCSFIAIQHKKANDFLKT